MLVYAGSYMYLVGNPEDRFFSSWCPFAKKHLLVAALINWSAAGRPDKRCPPHCMYLYQVDMTLHFLNDIESTMSTSQSLVWRVEQLVYVN